MDKEILIVDDQPGIRILLKDVFMDRGYSVSLAENGKEATEKIDEHSYDLIVLDYNLPILNGEQVLKGINEKNSLIPVILMSGLSEKLDNITKQFQNNIQILAKPFDIEEICAIVEDMLD